MKTLREALSSVEPEDIDDVGSFVVSACRPIASQPTSEREVTWLAKASGRINGPRETSAWVASENRVSVENETSDSVAGRKLHFGFRA